MGDSETMRRPPETPEQRAARDYKENTKSISADRMLQYETYALRLAVLKLSENVGKWLGGIDETLKQGLAAIALAASTPDDNSEEVEKQIERLKSSRIELDSSIEKHEGE